MRCDYSDLPTEQCAHCTGSTVHRWSPKAAARLTHVEPDTRTWRPFATESCSGRLYSPSVVPMPGWGSPCQVCGQLAGEMFVCPRCVERLECDCANVPALVEQLNITITRLDHVYAPAAPADAEADETMPYNIAASQALDALRWALATTALHAGASQAQWDDDDPEIIAAWIATNTATIASSDRGGPGVTSIREATSLALKAIDTLPERILAGPCPDCGTRLMAFKDATKVWCDVCQQRHQVAGLKAAMLDKLGRERGSTTAIANMLRAAGLYIPRPTVESWAARGKLTRDGETAMGSAAYLVADALPLAIAHRERQLTATMA